MNCHHFRATQKSISDAQELIWQVGGAFDAPPPSDKGLIDLMSKFGGKHCAKCKMEVKDLTNQRVDSSKMLTATFRPL